MTSDQFQLNKIMIDLPSQPGTYCLVFSCSTTSTVTIGKLGTYQINPSYYCYIGSAFGRGGLKSRINRHLRVNKRHHWHLDYLRPYLNPVEIYYSTDTIKLECQWAELLLKDEQSSIPIKQFGSSDCNCPAHLFYYEVKPQIKTFFEQCVTLVVQSRGASGGGASPNVEGEGYPASPMRSNGEPCINIADARPFDY